MTNRRQLIICRIRQIFSWLLLLGAIVLGLLVGLGILDPPSAAAAIRQLEEARGQMVYQSRQTLKDQHGNTWQAIAFQRIRPNGQTSFDVRLVGFPDLANIDHSQPLTLMNSLGKTLTATDTTHDIFTGTTSPESNIEPNVGQYNLQPLLSELQPAVPLRLSIPTKQGEVIRLTVSPTLIQEWQAVANSAIAPAS